MGLYSWFCYLLAMSLYANYFVRGSLKGNAHSLISLKSIDAGYFEGLRI